MQSPCTIWFGTRIRLPSYRLGRIGPQRFVLPRHNFLGQLLAEGG